MRTYIIIGCAYIIAGCVIAVLAFYEFYFIRASHSQKAPTLRPSLMKSIKVAGACFSLLVVFTISQMLCKHYHVGFGISFMISVLIALSFLGFYYKFKLHLNDFSEEKSKEDKDKESLNNLKK